jgi:hypothetical protein
MNMLGQCRSSNSRKRSARSQRSSVMPLATLIDRSIKGLTMLLHASKEFNNDLTGRTDQNLSPSTLLGVGDCFKTIGEY